MPTNKTHYKLLKVGKLVPFFPISAYITADIIDEVYDILLLSSIFYGIIKSEAGEL